MPCSIEAPCGNSLRIVLVTPERTLRHCLNAHSFVELHPIPPLLSANRPWQPAHRNEPRACQDCRRETERKIGLRCRKHCAPCHRAVAKRCCHHGGPDRATRRRAYERARTLRGERRGERARRRQDIRIPPRDRQRPIWE